MRFLLAIMAMTLFAVSVGCDAPPAETTTPDPAATGEADPAAEGDAHAEGDDHEDADSATSDVGATGETQTVSLKLPGMT